MAAVELRPIAPDEVAAVAELIRRSEAHDDVPRVLTDEELMDDLDAAYFDFAADSRAAVVDDEIVAVGWVWHPPSEGLLDRADLDGWVDPAHRGRGIGRALLGWTLERARERLEAADHGLPRIIRADAAEWLDDRQRLLRRFGFEAVRWSESLFRSLDELPDATVPEGITLVPWPIDREEEIRQVRNVTFADDWGSTFVDEERWQTMVHGHGGRPDLSVVAVDDATGQIVGLCLNFAYPEDEVLTGRREGILGNLGTLREARKRGVASAMLTWSLATFAGAGFTHAGLDVYVDNASGADRLYRALGFEPDNRTVIFQIALDD